MKRTRISDLRLGVGNPNRPPHTPPGEGRPRGAPPGQPAECYRDPNGHPANRLETCTGPTVTDATGSGEGARRRKEKEGADAEDEEGVGKKSNEKAVDVELRATSPPKAWCPLLPGRP